MSAERAPEAIEAQAIEHWNSKKGRYFDRPPEPMKGYEFIPDSEVVDMLTSHSEDARIGNNTVKFITRPTFMPRRKEVLTGIVEEDIKSGGVLPLIARVEVKREHFLLRSAKKACGVEPQAQYSLTLSVPEDDASVRRVVEQYRAFKAAHIDDCYSDEQVFRTRIAVLDERCNTSLLSWGIEPSAK